MKPTYHSSYITESSLKLFAKLKAHIFGKELHNYRFNRTVVYAALDCVSALTLYTLMNSLHLCKTMNGVSSLCAHIFECLRVCMCQRIWVCNSRSERVSINSFWPNLVSGSTPQMLYSLSWKFIYEAKELICSYRVAIAGQRYVMGNNWCIMIIFGMFSFVNKPFGSQPH